LAFVSFEGFGFSLDSYGIYLRIHLSERLSC